MSLGPYVGLSRESLARGFKTAPKLYHTVGDFSKISFLLVRALTYRPPKIIISNPTRYNNGL